MEVWTPRFVFERPKHPGNIAEVVKVIRAELNHERTSVVSQESTEALAGFVNVVVVAAATIVRAAAGVTAPCISVEVFACPVGRSQAGVLEAVNRRGVHCSLQSVLRAALYQAELAHGFVVKPSLQKPEPL